MKRLIPYLSKYKFKIIAAILLIVSAAVFNALSPLMEGNITTSLFADVTAGTGINFSRIYRIVAGLLLVYVLSALSNYLYQYILTIAIQDAMLDLREDISLKIRRMPISYFDQNPLGDTLSRVSSDVETISNALQQSFAQIMNAVLGLTLAVIMMFRIQWQMTFIALLIIALSAVASLIIVKKSQLLFEKQQKSLGDLSGIVQEKFTGFNEIKLFGKQEDTIDAFKQANEDLCKNGFQAQFISGLMSPVVSFVTYLGLGGVAVMGALLAVSGSLQVGQLQAFIRYIWQVNTPMSQITQLSSALQSSVAAIHRVFDFLDEAEEPRDVDEPIRLTDKKGNVRFEDVHFHYEESVPLLQGVNADIKSGQMIAIVGPTGVGKTTLINLLMRFYDVTGGAIKVDGADIRMLKREDLRSLFGMVLQDTWLYKGTIKENIAYGKEGATDEEIIRAAKIANVHHVIKTLPGGYDMVINEEASNISQGEKQLLTIARAVLCDPPIMILDEATSSVDTRLEQILQNAMHRIMEGRTSFVIAHRLSTIRNADLILVMSEGNIVEQGTHEELLAKKGYYEQLYYAQFAHN